MDQRQNKHLQNNPPNLLELSKKKSSYNQPKTNKQLIKLIEANETTFDNLAKSLSNQITEYQSAFNQKERDFQAFQLHAKKFKQNSFQFIDMIAKVKSNCSTVIQNLPQQKKLISKDAVNDFDIFVDEQIDRTIQFKLNKVKYNQKQQQHRSQ